MSGALATPTIAEQGSGISPNDARAAATGVLDVGGPAIGLATLGDGLQVLVGR